MPNRILKESICTSGTIESLTPEQETFFYRLLVQCDDYGEMDGRPSILRARLYPLRLARVTEKHIIQWLTVLASADIIQVYTVNDQPYLHIKTWAHHQQIRAQRHKYQPLDSPDVQLISPDNICNQLISTASNSPRNPIQSNPNPNPNPNPTPPRAAKQKLPENTYGEFQNVLLTDEDYRKLEIKLNSQLPILIENMSAWLKQNGKTYKDYYAALKNWSRRPGNGTSTVGLQQGATGSAGISRQDDPHLGPGWAGAVVHRPS